MTHRYFDAKVYPHVADTADMIKTIYPGTPWFPIDNMWPCTFLVPIPARYDAFNDDGRPIMVQAKSSEHAFQADKAATLADWSWIMAADDGYEAKSRGRATKLRKDWEETKRQTMLEVVRLKMAQCELPRRILLLTGDRRIEEGNWWGDRIWGIDLQTGAGRNWLGEILMQVRDEIRADQGGGVLV